MAGDLSEPPPGLSLRHLSRKLTKSIQSRAISDLWKRRTELGATIRHQWIRNLPGDTPARPGKLPWTWGVAPLLARQVGDHSPRPSLPTWPQPTTWISGPRSRTAMWPHPPGGASADPYGRHATCCTKGLHTRRHDRIRDLIAKLARQAGLTATTEQAMLIPDQIQADGQAARAVLGPFTVLMCISLNHKAMSCG